MKILQGMSAAKNNVEGVVAAPYKNNLSVARRVDRFFLVKDWR